MCTMVLGSNIHNVRFKIHSFTNLTIGDHGQHEQIGSVTLQSNANSHISSMNINGGASNTLNRHGGRNSIGHSSTSSSIARLHNGNNNSNNNNNNNSDNNTNNINTDNNNPNTSNNTPAVGPTDDGYPSGLSATSTPRYMNLNLGNYSIATNGLSIVKDSDSEVDSTTMKCNRQYDARCMK